jgi:hypothetical protein
MLPPPPLPGPRRTSRVHPLFKQIYVVAHDGAAVGPAGSGPGSGLGETLATVSFTQGCSVGVPWCSRANAVHALARLAEKDRGVTHTREVWERCDETGGGGGRRGKGHASPVRKAPGGNRAALPLTGQHNTEQCRDMQLRALAQKHARKYDANTDNTHTKEHATQPAGGAASACADWPTDSRCGRGGNSKHGAIASSPWQPQRTEPGGA